ncbi:hypothetical protein [Bacillus thuringiensis]|uniref:hypothetical protein n=1 Tax=Bacillus thuringiensis TaxID=1428 RepID=UPI00345A5435
MEKGGLGKGSPVGLGKAQGFVFAMQGMARWKPKSLAEHVNQFERENKREIASKKRGYEMER